MTDGRRRTLIRKLTRPKPVSKNSKTSLVSPKPLIDNGSSVETKPVLPTEPLAEMVPEAQPVVVEAHGVKTFAVPQALFE